MSGIRLGGISPNPLVVEMSAELLIYAIVPRPWTVENAFVLLRVVVFTPSTVEIKLEAIIAEKPFMAMVEAPMDPSTFRLNPVRPPG